MYGCFRCCSNPFTMRRIAVAAVLAGTYSCSCRCSGVRGECCIARSEGRPHAVPYAIPRFFCGVKSNKPPECSLHLSNEPAAACIMVWVSGAFPAALHFAVWGCEAFGPVACILWRDEGTARGGVTAANIQCIGSPDAAHGPWRRIDILCWLGQRVITWLLSCANKHT